MSKEYIQVVYVSPSPRFHQPIVAELAVCTPPVIAASAEVVSATRAVLKVVWREQGGAPGAGSRVRTRRHVVLRAIQESVDLCFIQSVLAQR